MKLKSAFAVLALLISSSSSSTHAQTQVAITVDDLPTPEEIPPGSTSVSITQTYLKAFKKYRVPEVYGFINGKVAREKTDGYLALKEWVAGGMALGNHTFEHFDLGDVPSEKYIENIEKNESVLNEVFPRGNYKYFRYPYLSEGDTKEKREEIRSYLSKNGYSIAPASLDFLDWAWSEAYARCVKKRDRSAVTYLKQTFISSALQSLKIYNKDSVSIAGKPTKAILLLHMNSFTALMLDELLSAYRSAGVQFITLQDALQDPVYQIDPGVVPPGLTFIEQLAVSKNPSITWPTRPIPYDKLMELCK